LPLAGVGVLSGVHQVKRGVTQNLPATGQMGAPLPPIAATAEKSFENRFVLMGVVD